MYKASNLKSIKILNKELEEVKLEKDGLDGKLARLLKASKNLDHLIESQRRRVQKETTRSQKYAYKSPSHRYGGHRPHGGSMRPFYRPAGHKPHGPSMNPRRPNMNVRTQYRAPWVPTVNRNNPPVSRKFSTGRNFFPIVTRKFPTASRKFTTGSTKKHTADMGRKGKAGSSQNNIDDKGYWDNGCSRHMTGNISYLYDFEPFDEGYVSFGQGGCRIAGKGTIKTESIMLGRNFKLLDDANILLRTPRRLGYLNVKTMNKLVRHNLVRGLPSKSFDNDHTCTACLKGKQHKASCNSKLVNSVTKPFYTLHMDLFGPTSVSSISHKWYYLVVTDDFSRFTWTFFLRSKDETSDILKKFITEIENLKDLKVKIIRIPQQNGVAERRNRTLIEAARIMLADAKLLITFWAEAVNAACYVQNQVFNKRTRRVEENLHIEFLENKAIEKAADPNWLFDIDSLTKSMNYVPVDAGTNSTNLSGTKDAANQEVKKDVSSLIYIVLPNWAHDDLLEFSSSKPHDESSSQVPKGSGNLNPTVSSSNPPADQIETLTVESPIPTVSSPVPTACLNDSQEPSSEARLILKRVANQEETASLDNILSLTNRFEDTLGVTTSSDESIGVEANTHWDKMGSQE
nr:hypothetical protein [Tanacetum cinerariifolium]